MSELNIRQLDVHLNAQVSSFKGALPDAGIETLTDLSVREYKVAFEVLCDLLAAQGLPVSRDNFARLVAIDEFLGVATSCWTGVVMEAH